MKATTIIGLILILVGAVGFFLGGIPFGTERTTVGVGPLEMTAETENEVAIPPIVSLLALVAGIGLIFVGARKA